MSLIQTNPYLKNRADLDRLVARSVRTSCAAEGISKKTQVAQSLDESRSQEARARLAARLREE